MFWSYLLSSKFITFLRKIWLIFRIVTFILKKIIEFFEPLVRGKEASDTIKRLAKIKIQEIEMNNNDIDVSIYFFEAIAIRTPNIAVSIPKTMPIFVSAELIKERSRFKFDSRKSIFCLLFIS